MKRPIDVLKQDIVFQDSLRGSPYTFHSTWGLFSPTAIDDGTRLLLDHIDVRPEDTIIDIGCGYGAPGIPLAALASKGSVHMVDKDFVAVEYAEKNARINHVANCKAYLSNAFSRVPDGVLFDTIVSNLPAKSGREFFDIMLHDGKERLRTGGKIYVVTIAGLKEFIKKNFADVFGNYKKLKQGNTYAVMVATKQ